MLSKFGGSNYKPIIKKLSPYEKLKERRAKKKERELLRKVKRKEKKENSYKRISKLAWTTFAKWLKKKNANFHDYINCYTCNKIIPVEESQAGHCFHRGNQRYKALDFDPEHIRLQCAGCNCFSSTQTNIFQAKLTRELGIEKVEQMIWRRKNEPALTVDDLKAIISKYNTL